MIWRMSSGSELSRYAVIMAGGTGTRFWLRVRDASRALATRSAPYAVFQS